MSHSYADDGQIYSSCLPENTDGLRERFERCIVAVMKWAEENRLTLNPAKTELLWLCTPRRQNLLSRDSFKVGGVDIAPTAYLRLLGIQLDETLTFEPHITELIRRCHYQLRRIGSVRRYLPVTGTIQLVRALVLSRLDYCNSVLLGITAARMNRLQSVLNHAARVVFRSRWSDHVTPLLRDRLHWLRVPERIIYKRCWFTFRALHDPNCPEYLATLVQRTTTNERRSHLRSSHHGKLLVPPPAKTAKMGERSFTRGNPTLWNTLPDNVTSTDSAGLFKKNLKTYLFRRDCYV